MSDAPLAMIAVADEHGATILCAPKLGVWSSPPPEGAFVEPGSTLGTLTQLTHRFLLVAPVGVTGRVALEKGKEGPLPVAYGEALVRVVPDTTRGAIASSPAAPSAKAASDSLVVVAPTDGVFYRAPSTGSKPFVSVGDRLVEGQAIGLIEVMKTFNPIVFGSMDLPGEAVVIEILASDGQEVRAGQALVVVKTL